MPALPKTVIPAQSGIQFVGLSALKINQMNNLDFGLRRNDGHFGGHFGNIHNLWGGLAKVWWASEPIGESAWHGASRAES
jgi:hypothetical protein